ncbi:MAG: hypothetical protein AAGD05_02950 [Bacteroidota bacterium]
MFQHICHVHYQAISDIVRKTAKEFNLPYYDQPSFRYAIFSHWKILRSLGRGESIPVV